MPKEQQRTTRPRLIARGKKYDGEPNRIDKHIGRRLRLRRQTLGWTQQQLADRLGLTFQQVQKYETGANRISGSRLYDLFCLLGVDANFFYQDMPADIRCASPRYISSATAAPTCAEEQATAVDDPMKSEKAIKIINSFARIPNRQIADALCHLTLLLGSSSWMLKKESSKNDRKTGRK